MFKNYSLIFFFTLCLNIYAQNDSTYLVFEDDTAYINGLPEQDDVDHSFVSRFFNLPLNKTLTQVAWSKNKYFDKKHIAYKVYDTGELTSRFSYLSKFKYILSDSLGYTLWTKIISGTFYMPQIAMGDSFFVIYNTPSYQRPFTRGTGNRKYPIYANYFVKSYYSLPEGNNYRTDTIYYRHSPDMKVREGNGVAHVVNTRYAYTINLYQDSIGIYYEVDFYDDTVVLWSRKVRNPTGDYGYQDDYSERFYIRLGDNCVYFSTRDSSFLVDYSNKLIMNSSTMQYILARNSIRRINYYNDSIYIYSVEHSINKSIGTLQEYKKMLRAREMNLEKELKKTRLGRDELALRKLRESRLSKEEIEEEKEEDKRFQEASEKTQFAEYQKSLNLNIKGWTAHMDVNYDLSCLVYLDNKLVVQNKITDYYFNKKKEFMGTNKVLEFHGNVVTFHIRQYINEYSENYFHIFDKSLSKVLLKKRFYPLPNCGIQNIYLKKYIETHQGLSGIFRYRQVYKNRRYAPISLDRLYQYSEGRYQIMTDSHDNIRIDVISTDSIGVKLFIIQGEVYQVGGAQKYNNSYIKLPNLDLRKEELELVKEVCKIHFKL